jgi:hypothetical protein
MRRIIPLVVCLTLAVVCVHAQSSSETLPRLTNKEVLEMVSASISPEVIIAKIKVSRCNFDTDPSILAELKHKGVTNEVMKAMIEAPYGAPKSEKPIEKPFSSAPLATPEPEIVENTARTDKWHGLILNQSTPEDAIRLFGSPKKDRNGGLRTYPLNKRLVVDHDSSELRKLYYDNIEGVEHVEIGFRQGRLVIVEIHPKQEIPASNLGSIYQVEFVPKVSEIEQSFNPSSVERDKGQVYPKDYPVTYYLIALTEKSYVSAFVENSVVGSVFLGNKRSKLGDHDSGGFPGKVKIIQIISRTLENREGLDVLK